MGAVGGQVSAVAPEFVADFRNRSPVLWNSDRACLASSASDESNRIMDFQLCRRWVLSSSQHPPLVGKQTLSYTIEDSCHGKKFRKPQALDHEDGRAEVQAVFEVWQTALYGGEEWST